MKQQPPVFSSLGSQYTWSTVTAALRCFFQPVDDAEKKVQQFLHAEHPGSQVYLTYKGRDALEIALRSLGVSVGDYVLTQAFACSSVEEAIIRVGARPLYVDLQKGTLAPSLDTLQTVYQQFVDDENNTTLISAVILQGTLGTVMSWQTNCEWARSNGIFVIADLAQSLGASTDLADAVVYSAGRDKVWDAVGGGAACMMTPYQSFQFSDSTKIPASVTWGALRYPLVTWLIRHTYHWQLGKYLHHLSRRLGWIQSPIRSEFRHPTRPSKSLLCFMHHQWQQIPDKVTHARQIAAIYHDQLAQFSPFEQLDIEQGSCLRYPVLVKDPKKLFTELRQENIHIADRWYRAPVDSGSVPFVSEYEAGSCPVAERYARHLINLPTHVGIDAAIAKRLIALVSPHGELV